MTVDDGTFDDFSLKKLACEAQRPAHEYEPAENGWQAVCKWCGYIKPHDSYGSTIMAVDFSQVSPKQRKGWFRIF